MSSTVTTNIHNGREWKASRHEGVYAFLIVLAGTLLRCYQAGYSLAWDEVFSAQAAASSYLHLLRFTIEDQVHPPLYYSSLYVWMKIWGKSEIAIRSLSILFSVLFLVALYKLSKKFVTGLPSLFILFIVAISPFFVYYGSNARPYAMISLFSVLSTYFLFEALESPSNGMLSALYGLSCLLLIYSQYMGVLILLPQLAVILWSGYAENKRTFWYGLLGTVSIIPWIASLVLLDPSGHGPKVRSFLVKPDLHMALSSYEELFGWLPFRGTTRLVLLISAFVLGAVVLSYRSLHKKHIALLAGMMLFPPFSAFAASYLAPVSIWATRQLIGSAIFVFCLLGVGLSLQRRWIALLLGSVLSCWMLLTVSQGFPNFEQPDWKTIAAEVREKCASCGLVVEEKYWFRPLTYYFSNDIYSVDEYEKKEPGADRIAFFCRPIMCDGRGDLASRLAVIDHERFGPAGAKPTPANTMDVYFLGEGTTEAVKVKSDD